MYSIYSNNMPNYFFVFNQQFDRDKGLDWGRLSLNQLNPAKTLHIWTATSSVESSQKAESFHNKGGLIPPQYRCKNMPTTWEVETKPIPMPSVKGVEGNFYKINPHAITTDKGGVRGDFGIHLDANVPGSMGCIVMDKTRFRDFEKVIKTIKQSGIPLFVFYS